MRGRQAKVITPPMLKRMLRRVSRSSFPTRDRAMILLSVHLWACGQRVCVVHMSIGCQRRAFAPDGHRRAIAERLMKSALVVEGEVFADTDFRLAAVGIAPQIDVLVF